MTQILWASQISEEIFCLGLRRIVDHQATPTEGRKRRQ
jgi:hypothetical protein